MKLVKTSHVVKLTHYLLIYFVKVYFVKVYTIMKEIYTCDNACFI